MSLTVTTDEEPIATVDAINIRAAVYVLAGAHGTSVLPVVLTGSDDGTTRAWDLGKARHWAVDLTTAGGGISELGEAFGAAADRADQMAAERGAPA